MKEPTKKPCREWGRLNRKSPLPSEEQRTSSPHTLTNILPSPKKMKSFGKPWETLATVGPIPRHLERAEAVAHFHLTTEHGFLGVYLYWLGMAANEACPLRPCQNGWRPPASMHWTR
ncbi:hypothetical protein TNCV_882711 [Trichonephila clavipes]|nr:hypothetical protein TNCV_882711 [Trichonephila clavipes]